jgi:hypothetical protein
MVQLVEKWNPCSHELDTVRLFMSMWNRISLPSVSVLSSLLGLGLASKSLSSGYPNEVSSLIYIACVLPSLYKKR